MLNTPLFNLNNLPSEVPYLPDMTFLDPTADCFDGVDLFNLEEPFTAPISKNSSVSGENLSI